jgi:hypothetical protein
MSFRDDHAAALARAHALDRALANHRADHERTKAELAAASRRIARLEAQLARARASTRVVEQPQPDYLPSKFEDAPEDGAAARFVRGLLTAILVAVTLVTLRTCETRAHEGTRDPPASCHP